MSVLQALNVAMSGLSAAQAGLSLVSSNVANAETPGYVRKSLLQEPTAVGNTGTSVRVTGVNRTLDQYLQRQLRVETSGGAYADLKSQMYQRLQQVYGDPSSPSSLATVYNNFTTALQGLSTNPADYSARAGVLNAAQVVTQQLNSLTTNIQALRTDAEQGLADSARTANDAMQRLAQINQQLANSPTNDLSTASLLDQRDHYIDQLSQLMDIRVSEGNFHKVTVFTASGVQLVGDQAAQLSFDRAGTINATSQWSANPAQRQVGTVTLTLANGSSLDLLASNSIRSGQIAAYVEMRDQVLVQAQNQLDQVAGAMSQALSDSTTAGTAVTVGTQSGFDVDVGALLAGNKVQITYTDPLTSAQKTVTVIRVNDPKALPLADSVTADPNDKVVGVDWSGGLPSVVTQLNSALGGVLQFSNPTGTILRTLNAATSNAKVTAVSATSTATSLVGGTSQLPFFQDGNAPFSSAMTSAGSQLIGFAGRITVNSALLADPSKLVVYQAAGTPSGDTTRANFIYNQLTSASSLYLPQSGIGTQSAPFSGTIPTFISQALSQQSSAANAASSLAQGQDMVVKALKQRFSNQSDVSVDQEMSNLLALQTAYGANARVLTTVKDMIDMLLKA